MNPSLCALRDSMEGSTPALIATCALDGTPNLSYLSAVHYLDPAHIALSFQFFSQTRRNVLENPIARILLIDPFTARRHRLLAQYLRTETEGATFEKIGAKLAGIASHSGMDGVFRLQGADIYRVLAIEPVDCPGLPQPLPPNLLPPLRALIETVAQAVDLEHLFDSCLAALERQLEIAQAMILLCDDAQARLFTVAARGYPGSQIGSEVPLGKGVIGVAARTGVPIRINHALAEHGYAQVVRSQALALDEPLEPALPFHGLANPGSQLALPIRLGATVSGVLYVEDLRAQRFSYHHEDALATLADALGLAIGRLQEDCEAGEAPDWQGAPAPRPRASTALQVRFYARLSTLFIDGQYVIKGIAGAILWKLLREYRDSGRRTFSSRELRADSSLNLPEISDNLATRLLLLRRRLDEMALGISLRKCGRGQVELRVEQPLELEEG